MASDPPSRPRLPVPRGAGARHRALSVAVHGAALWAAALVVYFLNKEGALPPALSWPVRDGHPGAARAVWAGLAGSWSPYRENIPAAGLAAAALALAYLTALGAALVSCLRVRTGVTVTLALGFPVGAGAAGLVFEALAMSGRLTPWAVRGAAAAMAAAAALALWRRLDGPLHHEAGRAGMERSARRLKLAFVPDPWPSRAARWACYTLTSAIGALVTLHAVGQPETYWDSLLYYMAYARETFQRGGYPVKVVGQMSMGLAANYPHLFETLAASTAAAAGWWHEAMAQALAPACWLASVVLVRDTALGITRNRTSAAACTLLFAAVPEGIVYFQYASAYALAMLFTAAFLHAAWKAIETGERDWLWLLAALTGFGAHVNYLMLALFPVAAVVAVLARRPAAKIERAARAGQPERAVASADRGLDVDALPEVMTPEAAAAFDGSRAASEAAEKSHMSDPSDPSDHPGDYHPGDSLRLGGAPAERRPGVTGGFIAAAALLAVALAAPWYVRNFVVTGNPVYPFFTALFPGTLRVNPEVMASARVEWLLNGDGLGTVGRSLPEKLGNSWYFFVTGPHHWKLSPVMFAFAAPGLLLAMALAGAAGLKRLFRARAGGAPASPWTGGRDLHHPGRVLRFAAVAALLAGGLLFYAYVVADMYLYQIVNIVTTFPVFAAVLFAAAPAGRAPAARAVLLAAALAAGVTPGLTMAIMGFKLKSTGTYVGMPPPQFAATALKRLFMDPKVARRMAFGGDMDMMDRLARLPAGARLLTHENRFLLMPDPRDLPVTAMDDWEPQQAYRHPAVERLAALDALGVTHYLYVPNEDKHQTNALLGMDELIRAGHYRETARTASSVTSTPELNRNKTIPKDMNTLYERTGFKPMRSKSGVTIAPAR